MRKVLVPGVDSRAFLARAKLTGYSMAPEFFHPGLVSQVSNELRTAGLLEDLVELQPTSQFSERGMRAARLLHATLSEMVSGVEGQHGNHLPLFSVRVFEPGTHATTIHRNHPIIGPWAIGVTLRGFAPFSVYEQDQLKDGTVLPLVGDGTDPAPLESMDASAGAAWTLYTANEFVPHSGGLVTSKMPRELLILYDRQD